MYDSVNSTWDPTVTTKTGHFFPERHGYERRRPLLYFVSWRTEDPAGEGPTGEEGRIEPS